MVGVFMHMCVCTPSTGDTVVQEVAPVQRSMCVNNVQMDKKLAIDRKRKAEYVFYDLHTHETAGTHLIGTVSTNVTASTLATPMPSKGMMMMMI